MADDLGYEGLGCYGGTSYLTPNLDRLAAGGMRFNHAYSTPLCSNTRIQLMTGRYAQRSWIAFGILGPTERTFGHLMQEAGYRTCIAGKWQLQSYDPPDYPGAESRRGLGMHAKDAGFHSWSLWHTGHTEVKGSRYANPVIHQDGLFRQDSAGRYGPDLWVDYLNNFMTENKDQPFFVYYSMALPHWPMVPTPDSPEWKNPDRRLEEDNRFFKDMVEYTDKCVGRVVDKIAELGLSENTLILFYSDNGTNQKLESRLGDRIIRGGKGLTTDAGTRVPLIGSWSGRIKPGEINNDLIDSTDFFATLADLVKHPLKGYPEIDGRTFLPQLFGRKGKPRQHLFCHFDPRPGWDKDKFRLLRYARDHRWKLYDDGRLFDLSRDVLEEHPVLLSSQNGTAVAARGKLQTVLKQYPLP